MWQALDEEKYLEVNIKHHIAESFREDLEKAGFVTSAQLKRKRNGEHVKIAGRVVLIQMSPTRSGIRIMFITIEDEQQYYAKKVLENLVVLCEGTVRRLGIRDTSVVIKSHERSGVLSKVSSLLESFTKIRQHARISFGNHEHNRDKSYTFSHGA